MGCDIHALVEVKRDGKWTAVKDRLFPLDFKCDGHTHCSEPFSNRNYGVFGFLADVRNYSHVPPISQARGLPEDASVEAREFGDGVDYHSRSWLSVKELWDFDYRATFEDRRCTRDGNGGADAGRGNGVQKTFSQFLGENFFRDLVIMRKLDDDPDNVRVVFCFDS